MPSLNRVFLIGNLTRDVELKYTQSGLAIAEFGLAVNRKSKDGKEEVLFADITVFARQAETCSEYLAKGRPVFIEGRLKLDQWNDKETGQKRSKLGVIAERVQFLGGKDDNAGTKGRSDERSESGDDDDIPF